MPNLEKHVMYNQKETYTKEEVDAEVNSVLQECEVHIDELEQEVTAAVKEMSSELADYRLLCNHLVRLQEQKRGQIKYYNKKINAAIREIEKFMKKPLVNSYISEENLKKQLCSEMDEVFNEDDFNYKLEKPNELLTGSQDKFFEVSDDDFIKQLEILD
jgi:division protein CdvB (Snf7/Vps24/ESCRT-III family)